MGRPDWNKVMADCGGAHPHDNERVIITRGTARLAASALRAQNSADYYHNYGAAEVEINETLARPVPSDQQKNENLNASLMECEDYCATKTHGTIECNCGSWYFRKIFAERSRQAETGEHVR